MHVEIRRQLKLDTRWCQAVCSHLENTPNLRPNPHTLAFIGASREWQGMIEHYLTGSESEIRNKLKKLVSHWNWMVTKLCPIQYETERLMYIELIRGAYILLRDTEYMNNE